MIVIQLERIANVLEAVASANSDKQTEPIGEDESIGSCPKCDSTDTVQQGQLPRAVFRCAGCNFIWMNNANEFFSS